MSLVDSIPLSLVASQIPNSCCYEACDICIFRNFKWLLCARSNVICIYKSIVTVDPLLLKEGLLTLHQIINNPYSEEEITSVRWCKSGVTALCQRGEFVVASGAILTVFAPISLMSLTPTFESFKVSNMYALFSCSGCVAVSVGLMEELASSVGVATLHSLSLEERISQSSNERPNLEILRG